MIRIILCAILVSSTSIFFTGCSIFSGGDKKDQAETTSTESSDLGGLEGGDLGSGDDLFAEESDDFFGGGDEFSADTGDASATGGTDAFADSGSAESGDDFGFGDFPDEPVSDSGTADATTGTDDFGFGDTSTTTDTAATDDFGFGDTSTFTDTGADTFGSSDSSFPGYEDTMTDTSTDYLSSTDTSTDGTNFVEQPSYVPVKKIESAAFNRGGENLNRVYIVRPGESLSDVSMKIFGSDRSEDIKKWNPYFSSRSPKVGDKVYYPSQSQPTDQQMLTFYEEQGISPQTYITQDGDNIRTLAESWLGHSRSWMEVWATNPNVDSKWTLPAGIELKYWPTTTSTTPIADANAGSDMSTADASTGGVGGESDTFDDDMNMDSSGGMDDSIAGSSPPPADPFDEEPSDIAMNDSGSDTSMSGSGSLNVPPPPPPPPPPPAASTPRDSFMPPPPPPAPKRPTIGGANAQAQGESPDQMMIFAAAGLGVLGVLFLLILIKRRRNRAVDLGQTQV